jgi:membrane protein DedA with SNARE-associated domain
VTTPPPEEAAEEEATDTPDRSATFGPPSRRAVTAVGVLLAIMVVMNSVGDALTTSWADQHPAWLIALNSRNRVLALTTNQLDAWSYYSIASARLLASDPLFYLLGLWYGDSAITWMEKRTQTWGQMLRQLEGWFSKAAYPLVFLAPNNPICLFAGAAGMPVRAFLALNVSGTIVRLYVIRRAGEAFEAPLDDVLGFFGEYRLPLFVLSVVLLVVSIALEAKKGETEVTALTRLDDELESEQARRAEGPERPERPERPGVGPGDTAGPDR